MIVSTFNLTLFCRAREDRKVAQVPVVILAIKEPLEILVYLDLMGPMELM